MSDRFVTKGEIRASALKRCGFGSQGAAAGPIINVIDEKIEDAYDVLFDVYDVRGKVADFFLTTIKDLQWYEVPPGLDYDKIDNIACLYSNIYIPVEEHISLDHESVADIQHYPQRYDIQGLPVSAIEWQSNGDMAINDVTATGGTGFTWVASAWQISLGVLANLGAGADVATSTFSPTPGVQYTVSYTIAVSAMASVVFGGATTDIAGSILPITVGTHTVTVEAVTANGLTFTTPAAAGATIDDVSIKNTLPELKTMLKLWPEPDGEYLVKIKGTLDSAVLVNDADIAYVDATMIKKYVTAHTKAHLNRSDAQAEMASLNKRIKQVVGHQHGNKRYVRGKMETRPLPKPVVVDGS